MRSLKQPRSSAGRSLKKQNIMKHKIASVFLAAGIFATSFTASSQQPSAEQTEYHKSKAYMDGEYSPTRGEFIAWNQQAEYSLNQTWSQLSARQRDQLRYEERKWITYKDSLALEKRLREVQNRITYLENYLQQ
jgi:hypothetical protein